jgi:hypothetical protein
LLLLLLLVLLLLLLLLVVLLLLLYLVAMMASLQLWKASPGMPACAAGCTCYTQQQPHTTQLE